VVREYGHESTRTRIIAESLTDEFPHARGAYWVPTDAFSAQPRDGGLERQAEDLLQMLRKGRPTRGQENNRGIPIVFICWGTAGGTLLKQASRSTYNHTNWITDT
jgi:hypothetical protein